MFERLKKSYFPLYLLLLFFSTATWSGQFDRGILWKVSKAGQEPSHVLGTIHSDDPSVTQIPRPVKSALERSTSFTAELDLNLTSMLSAQMQMILPGDQTLEKIIGKRRYQDCIRLMSQYGMPEMMVAKMKPWAIAAQLNMPKPKSGVFLDLKLYQIAQSQGKQTYGLETVAEQMGVFEAMSEKQQLEMLDLAIRDYPKMPGKIRTLLRYYVNRDLRGMKQFSEREMRKVGTSLSELMNDKLIVERNHRMVDRMQRQLAAGKAFIAVGSLHLPGEHGILNLLQQRGYEVRAVY